MSINKNSIFTILISGTVGWSLNKLYRKNELNIHGIKDNHDIIIVRQINIYDNKYNDNKLNIQNENELLKFVENFNKINKKYKGFCETSIFKNSSFSNFKNEHSDKSFNTYLIIDKWKTKNDFEKSKEEFKKLFLQKNDEYNEKMKDIYYKFEVYNNKYETTSAKNILQKIIYFFFE
ncbi:conserved Plasmodium protein, unknown function [Plasmodium gallinaceum]|uniref:Uncharacterized protein n=1 Tax=Plasmodium gallinaceum TaxID=5849 RepID=A0A1J1GYP0_PLAGA|nr:conserved Plasmodium protein, unknown function [Plasmodium gallinaceum]CRG97431.1 conserved Plasmodium protein, unknown function [Plasmodium gallinaceum]